MARKESITIQRILNTAFTMTREEGFANVTARKLAARVECSTQPIFRVYKNMDELQEAIYLQSAAFFQNYYSQYPKISKTPFVNLGMAYIAFAREERHLFKLLFLSDVPYKKSMYELLNGGSGNVVYEINLARVSGCPDPSGLFMKMWIFIHGAACMSLTGDYDLADQQTQELLEETYGKQK